MEIQLPEDVIDSYPEYIFIQDPYVLIILGSIIAVFFGLWFARIMNIKIISWEKEKKSPNPLRTIYTMISWSGAFLGLTLFFTGMLEVFAFSPINSLMASVFIALVSGTTMWRVIKELLEQLEAGNIKEIDEYF